jgi:ectoine hydroxylase-related dioxygenase (phytanoyl-CoA dioxygenase family)
MKPFRELRATGLASGDVQHHLREYGYVLIRELLPQSDIQQVLSQITQVLSASAWLLPGHPAIERAARPSAACGETDAAFKPVYERVFNLESFHALAHHEALRGAMQMLTGPRLLIHPKPVARLIFPNCDRFIIQSHQDHLAIGGDADCFTAWMPLHDCPVESGPLRILEGSHRHGFRSADPATGTVAVARDSEDDWAGGAIRAGDVLFFHSLTIHCASPNTSTQMRISMDCRFQDVTCPIHPASLVFPGSNDRSWQATYDGWHSNELQYFWKKMPLTFRPTLDEISVLSETDNSPRMRTRYGRILTQLMSQMAVEDHAGFSR